MNKSFSALAVLCAACAVHACNADAVDDDHSADNDMNPDGTDTGNPYGDPDNGEGTVGSSGCLEEETELDPNAPTSLGFTAQSIIELVAGVHTSSLLWVDSPMEYGPEMGLSEITLDITPIGAPLFVDREMPTTSGNGEEGGDLTDIGEIYRPCGDAIMLNVSIHVTTAGGALDEVVETEIIANAGDFASTSLSFPLDDINGSFETTLALPDNVEVTGSWLTAQLGFTPYGSAGSFSTGSTFESLDGSAIGMGTGGEIAHFPAENYCGFAAVSVTADQAVRGLSMAQALDALNAMSPGPVRYASGAPSDLTLAFTSSEERICARFDETLYGQSVTNMTLEFPGVVRLISTDGRIDGTVPLTITASNDVGAQRTTAQSSFEDGEAMSPAQFGIQDAINFSAYDGSFVQFLTTAAPDSSGGSLRAYGLDVADCVNNPPPPDPNGQGTPGCRGTDRIPLWGAFFGDWDQNSQ